MPYGRGSQGTDEPSYDASRRADNISATRPVLLRPERVDLVDMKETMMTMANT